MRQSVKTRILSVGIALLFVAFGTVLTGQDTFAEERVKEIKLFVGQSATLVPDGHEKAMKESLLAAARFPSVRFNGRCSQTRADIQIGMRVIHLPCYEMTYFIFKKGTWLRVTDVGFNLDSTIGDRVICAEYIVLELVGGHFLVK